MKKVILMLLLFISTAHAKNEIKDEVSNFATSIYMKGKMDCSMQNLSKEKSEIYYMCIGRGQYCYIFNIFTDNTKVLLVCYTEEEAIEINKLLN
jgi:hypothetical protein